MITTTLPHDSQTIEKLREAELRSIQSVMMPAESLRPGAVMISHGFQPVSTVGGVFLDHFHLLDGTIGLYLCDVSGKGLPAALYAALAVGTLRGVHKTGASPSETLAIFNRRWMIRGMPRRHAAIRNAIFDPRSNELQIASAGMPGPLLLCAGGDHCLELSGIPPGLFENTNYETLTRRLNPGDSVLFCTDGIPEALDKHGEQFGLERLQDLCKHRRHLPPTELLGQIFSAVEDFYAAANNLTIWPRPCSTIAVNQCLRSVPTQACREWAKGFGKTIDRSSGLQ